MAERQSCKLKVLGSSPSGGLPLASDCLDCLFARSAESQFARVVKGVDLRSTEGNFAWVRTPQLTRLWHFEGPCRLVVRTSRCGRDNPGSNPGKDIIVGFVALLLLRVECVREVGFETA